MSKNILLAEDEKKLREQLLEILERHHYNVDLAEDGAQALRLGEEGQYDLAIIDLGLPKMSGMDVIAKLRDEGRRFINLTQRPRNLCNHELLAISGLVAFLLQQLRISRLDLFLERVTEHILGADQNQTVN